MAWVSVGARNGLRGCLLSLAAIATALTINSDAAVARHHHRVYTHHRHAAEGYDPPFASIVVDGNSGAVLQASNPDALRHPASLTKVMTLYLLFERLDAGRLKLDTPLPVSDHASEQDPTKLGLKPGQTIAVEDAIKGIVTRSANDAAVVIAEYLGGSEDAFAKLMTQKAHALGMAHTTYVNASGLPDDDQITTARDQALLGRAIQDSFPRYYKFFSTQAFEFHGETIRGHDHLLSEVEGVDGIKTGFTTASGFNLLTSLHRDGRYLVAVVMGGPSASERDARMRGLIADHIKEAALHRTAPMIADATIHHNEPIAFANSPLSSTKLTSTSLCVAFRCFADGKHQWPGCRLRRSDQAGSGADDLLPDRAGADGLAGADADAGAGRACCAAARCLQPSAQSPSPAAATEQRPTVVASAAPTNDLKISAPALQAAPTAPAKPTPITIAPAAPAQIPAPVAARTDQAPLEADRAEIADAQPAKLETAIPSGPIHAHGGWLIQIGAFDDENDAKQHLSNAQLKAARRACQQGSLHRARPEGRQGAVPRPLRRLREEASAEAACRELKRSDFQCMALKD